MNFMMDEGWERVQAICRDTYQRLVKIKNNPTNLLRINQDIRR